MKGHIILTLVISVILGSCFDDPVFEKHDRGPVPIPVGNGSNFSLYSEDTAIYPDKSVLKDPNNIFALANLTEFNKWDYAGSEFSEEARFYMWATRLAKWASGENQYYTAEALHQMFSNTGNEDLRQQAIRAYRSVLVNFFYDITWFEYPPGSEDTYPYKLNRLACERLYDPSGLGLRNLFDDHDYPDIIAMGAIASWGFVYDRSADIVYDRWLPRDD